MQVNWTSNDIGAENMFDLKFIDSQSGDEISNATYSIMLFRGQEHFGESHREDQTAAQQNYTFEEEGSYTLRIENINGSGTKEGIDIPMQVTAEFPPLGMIFLIKAALFGSIIFVTRSNNNRWRVEFPGGVIGPVTTLSSDCTGKIELFIL